MTLPLEINKETLVKMKEALPHGSIELIADRSNSHRNLVGLVLSGKKRITTDNVRIITEAQRIIREVREESNKLNAEILKTLGK